MSRAPLPPPCLLCGRRSRSMTTPSGPFRRGETALVTYRGPICTKHLPVLQYGYECSGCGALVWGWPGQWLYRGLLQDLIEYMHRGARVVACPACQEALPRAVPIGPLPTRPLAA